MSKLKKLFQVLGFWSLIISILPIILFVIASTIQNIPNPKIENCLGVALLIIIITFPNIALGFSISGLIKDKSKTLAIIGLIISVLMILFSILYLDYGFLYVG